MIRPGDQARELFYRDAWFPTQEAAGAWDTWLYRKPASGILTTFAIEVLAGVTTALKTLIIRPMHTVA